MASGDTAFDIDILKVFMNKVSPFPKGIEVLLSNGERGLVIDNTKDLSLRPTLKIFMAKDEAVDPTVVDLATSPNYRNVTITEVLHSIVHL